MRYDKYKFPHPPLGKYYVVDASFPMERGFMKPYPDTMYHIPEFARASQEGAGKKEIFNKRHSSLRNVVERTFGILKRKWGILRDIPSYSVDVQADIVLATTALHNFIRRHVADNDIDFENVGEGSTSSSQEDVVPDGSQEMGGDGVDEMKDLRDSISNLIFESL